MTKQKVDFTFSVELRCTIGQLAALRRWMEEHPEEHEEWPQLVAMMDDRLRQPISIYVALPVAAKLPVWAQELMGEGFEL
jgi:hypothetical protein